MMRTLAALALLASVTVLAAPARAQEAGADGGNGATTVRPDSGASDTGEEPEDEGCSASGSRSSDDLAVVGVFAVSAAFLFSGRRRRRARR